MDHIVTRWLLKDMSYSLFENLDSIFDLMVSAFLKPHQDAGGAPRKRSGATRENRGYHWRYNWQQQPRDQKISWLGKRESPRDWF